MANQNDIIKLAGERTKLIDLIIEKMESEVGKAQNSLMRQIAEDYVDNFDVDQDGRIKNTLANKRRLATLDRVYAQYVQDSGVKVVETIVKGVQDVMDFNGKYYGIFTGKAQLGTLMAETKTQISDWLGITKRGGLVENGYLNRLVKDPGILNTIKDSVFKSVVSQKGFFEVKKDLKDFIGGNKNKTGALQQYYRNFVYDTFSQVDRTQNKMFADKLDLKYAIYEGGLIKTSREFCKKRNGKVFTTEEIAKFNPTTARPPNYNPFTDLGGYGCRHHLNYIPYAIAVLMRPDLKKAA